MFNKQFGLLSQIYSNKRFRILLIADHDAILAGRRYLLCALPLFCYFSVSIFFLNQVDPYFLHL